MSVAACLGRIEEAEPDDPGPSPGASWEDTQPEASWEYDGSPSDHNLAFHEFDVVDLFVIQCSQYFTNRMTVMVMEFTLNR